MSTAPSARMKRAALPPIKLIWNVVMLVLLLASRDQAGTTTIRQNTLTAAFSVNK